MIDKEADVAAFSVAANNTAQRLKCAAQFGTNHSIAAAFRSTKNGLVAISEAKRTSRQQTSTTSARG